MRSTRALLAMVLCMSAAGSWARGQVLPFDHWLNLYLETAAASPNAFELQRAVWPQDRQAATSLATRPAEARAGVPLPVWAYELLRAELRHEIAAQREESSRQWDAWRVGPAWLSGERLAAQAQGGGYFLHGEGRVQFAPGVYVYLRVRATPDSAEVPAFTGHPREKRRLGGLNAAECDYAFIECAGAWLTARFGRFKESWGPGDANSVWLSAWGPAYDGALVELRYRRFQFRALTAYLETVVDRSTKGNVHRYLATHMLTYGNGRTLWLGVGEGMLYAGVDRPLSIAYANPFMMYQEYERNARTNELSKNRDNWFLTGWVEWFPVRRLRTWAFLMIDDVQLDREPIPDATGVRAGASYVLGPTAGVARYDYVRISTWTYRHQTPHINYVARGLPLGFRAGSDMDRHEASWTGFPLRYVTARAWLAYERRGELDIVQDPYRLREFPHHWRFPWGVVEKTAEVGVAARFQPRPNVLLEGGFQWRHRRNAGHGEGKRVSEVAGQVALSLAVDFSVHRP
ncbi:MAG: hypothetical protein H5U38_13195 [Calditrichaeota bacterium]|nr:hypothetical protein [Calditrichota bacterium]